MKSMTRTFLAAALLLALVGMLPGLDQPATVSAAELPSPALSTTTGARTINAPHFNASELTGPEYNELAIFWFGKVTATENFTDVRIGYTDDALWVMASVFDRLVWYDTTHNPANLAKYDSMTLYLNTGTATTALNAATYRFDAQVNWFEERALYQLAYRGAGSTWKRDDTISFVSQSGYAGGQFNNGKENRGWAINFVIPFSSLGLPGKPADLSSWGMGLTMHDRDTRTGTLLNRSWPENTLSSARPSTWGRLVFGMPTYTPAATNGTGGTTIVRHKLNGAVVTDGGVGGDVGHLCADKPLWTVWGNYNYLKNNSTIIQNQSNLHDFPCFSKFYMNFPLSLVPKGKVITSAKLVMYEMGGSDWTLARPSLIQVSTIKASFSEGTLTWNNAPMAQENVAATWVDPVPHSIEPNEWPGWKYEWDVTRAVAEAYKSALPARLVMYEADAEMHSGKQFNTSQTADWNATGRPTLVIEWGNP